MATCVKCHSRRKKSYLVRHEKLCMPNPVQLAHFVSSKSGGTCGQCGKRRKSCFCH